MDFLAGRLVEQIVRAEWDARFPKYLGFPLSEAMLLKVDLSINHDKESGYRWREILIFGPMNYIGVWMRDCWNVIPLEDLQWDEEQQDDVIKPGRNYKAGNSEWQCLSYHDSCWGDAINRLFSNTSGEIQSLRIPLGHEGWYERLTLDAEKIRHLLDIEAERRHGRK